MRHSDETIRAAYERHNRNGAQAAAELGMTRQGFNWRIRRIRRMGVVETPALLAPTLSISDIPDPEEPMHRLIERAIEHSDRLMDHHHAKQLIDIRVHVDGPIAVAGLPDPHLNNPGTDLRQALYHAELIRNTDGVYCIGVGDWLDNFIIGRLERERRGDIMTHSDANRLQEHYITILAPKLLAVIGGNHNDWPAMLGGHDPLRALMQRLNKAGIYDADEVRFRLTLPSGHQFVHLVRHIFPGHSQYNTTHGVLKWALQQWQGEDVLWGGHIHASGHIEVEREYLGEAKSVNCIQLASYKKLDGYATKRGFRKNAPFLCPLVIHDPETGSTEFFKNIERGLQVLQIMRQRKAA